MAEPVPTGPVLLGDIRDDSGVWPLWMYEAGLQEDVPIESFTPGTWVCNRCFRVTFGPATKCYGQKSWRCYGAVQTTLAGYVREPPGRTKRRSQAALEGTRSKYRRMVDNAAANIRATAAVEPTWMCQKWQWKQGQYCGAENLMARYECVRCSTRITTAEWWKAAERQGFNPDEGLAKQRAQLQRMQKLHGIRGGISKSKKNKKQVKKKVVIVVSSHHSRSAGQECAA